MLVSDRLAILGGTPAVGPRPGGRWPEITVQERNALERVLRRGVLGGANAPEVSALEEEYAAYVGVRHALVTNSGTAALHAAVAALGVAPGDEVIVPAFTFVASAMAVLHQGARPVFADVDSRTYNLDASAIAARITDRTRAIMVVHVHGQPADVDEIRAVAARHSLPVIEDNAQAHGIRYRGAAAGGLTECGGSSLNQSKNLPAGEGGIFTTNDDRLILAARRLAVFGEDLRPTERRAFWSHGTGWNYRNQELACAFARSQLSRLDAYNARAMDNAARLDEGLADLPGVRPPFRSPDRGSSYWKYAVQLDPAALDHVGDPRDLRDRFLRALQAEGVDCMVWQPHPVPAQPAFRRQPRPWASGVDRAPLRPWDPSQFPVASRLCATTINLGTEIHPLYVQTAEQMDAWSYAVRKVVHHIEELVDAPLEPTPRPI